MLDSVFLVLKEASQQLKKKKTVKEVEFIYLSKFSFFTKSSS